MRIVLFCHSILSCWNHGNAHFLRGCVREFDRLGHQVAVYEPADGWSRRNALSDGGADVLAEARQLLPRVTVHSYLERTLDIARAVDGADLVIVHEWNTPTLIAAIGRHRAAGGRFTLLFHDTHHRAVSAPHDMAALDLDGFDGVLAFGEVLRQVYMARGWGRRVFTWHEAADTALFRPLPETTKSLDLIWIGNWGDDERSAEISAFVLDPIARLGLLAAIHGVRYPAEVLALLAARGIAYNGWLPNHRAPQAFARARATVHVPRGPYVTMLPGIPTVRVFEALACGIPLVCAPWSDAEGLFPAGAYITARNGEDMSQALSRLLRDHALCQELAATGLQAIRDRHTCAHRVEELLAILDGMTPHKPRSRPAARAPESMVQP